MFLWFILVILLFLSAMSDTVSVSSAIIAQFFELLFAFEIWVFLVHVQNFGNFF